VLPVFLGFDDLDRELERGGHRFSWIGRAGKITVLWQVADKRGLAIVTVFLDGMLKRLGRIIFDGTACDTQPSVIKKSTSEARSVL
jgi:hypothetical protein